MLVRQLTYVALPKVRLDVVFYIFILSILSIYMAGQIKAKGDHLNYVIVVKFSTIINIDKFTVKNDFIEAFTYLGLPVSPNLLKQAASYYWMLNGRSYTDEDLAKVSTTPKYLETVSEDFYKIIENSNAITRVADLEMVQTSAELDVYDRIQTRLQIAIVVYTLWLAILEGSRRRKGTIFDPRTPWF